MTGDTSNGSAVSHFRPMLTDSGDGPSFTMLGTIIPGGLEEYFMAVGKCSPSPSPAQLAEMARPFGLTLLPPGA